MHVPVCVGEDLDRGDRTLSMYKVPETAKNSMC